MKCLILKLEPQFTKFNTLIAEPNLATDLIDIEEPTSTNDNTEIPLATLETDFGP